MQASKSRTVRGSAWVLFNIACIVWGIVCAVCVVGLWAKPKAAKTGPPTNVTQIAAPPNSTPSQPTAGTSARDPFQEMTILEKEIATQGKALVAERDELTRIDDIAKVLMTAAGIFGLLLGLASWKALDEQRSAASANLLLQQEQFTLAQSKLVEESKRSIDRSIEQSNDSLEKVTKLRNELERDFPMFGRMRNNFATILYGLQSVCSRLTLEEDETYLDLSWDERQRIIYFENAITTALLLSTNEFSKQLSEIYCLLGVFYGSRFFSSLKESEKEGEIEELKDKRDIDRTRFYRDLDRSRFYFDHSIELDAANYLAYLNAGHFTQYPRDLPLAVLSRNYFRLGATVGPRYQKPWVAISLIELEAFRDSGRALDALDHAIQNSEYTLGRPNPAPNLISYLQGCGLCLRAEHQGEIDRESSLTEAIEKLRPAFLAPSQYIRKNFPKDRDAYFKMLTQNAKTAEAFNQLVVAMNKPTSEPMPSYN